MTSAPPPPRLTVPSDTGTLPAVRPVPPSSGTASSSSAFRAHVATPNSRPLAPPVLSKPYALVWDANPVLWICVYRAAIRKGFFSLGWWIMEDDLEVVAHTSDFGVFPPDSEEATSYDQYHPHLPGGRL